jgi:hypothetical protein
MIPDDELSTTPVPGDIIGGRALEGSAFLDHEDGGVGLGDAGEGLTYQIWKGTNDGSDIKLIDELLNETVIYSGSDISEFSFSFDQNMQYVVTFIENDVPKLKWYDSTIEDYAVTEFAGIESPKVFLDEKRLFNLENSDVIFTYLKVSLGVPSLYFRQQRDRYGVEYFLKEITGYTNLKINKFGMSDNLRLQWEMG